MSRHPVSLVAAGLAGVILYAYGLPAAMAQAEDPAQDTGEAESEDPPTTLPFEPTVRSAPPSRPEYPERTPSASPPPPPPPPPDTLCTEIGPIIRAGVVASRFASLSPSTSAGAAVGTYEGGGGLEEIGGEDCTVVIPAADSRTADAPYNQVTCQLTLAHGDSPYLKDMRDRRDELATRISECPAVSEWSGTRPGETPLSTGDITEDYIFTHPRVAVEIVLRASHHEMSGDWPLDQLRKLSLIFRTPNPDRPEPETEG